MRLKEIRIKNFRSIKQLTIDFKENPRVLVGINEAGKTNILHALRLLSHDYPIHKTDIREPVNGVINEAYVIFAFELETEDKEEIFKKVKQKILIDDHLKKIGKTKKGEYNLFELCQKFNEACYVVDLVRNTKTVANIVNPIRDEFIFTINFKKVKPTSNFSFKDKNGNALNLINFKLIDYKTYKEIVPIYYLDEFKKEDLVELINSTIIEIVNQNLPKVIFWEYKEENLLPPLVSIDTFQSNPNSCIPLKNLFIIADIPEEKISPTIREARENFNSFHSLLDRVAEAATKFFRNTWPEYKCIKFSLLPTETNIRCGVEEKNIWDFQRRSDGFKRFISLLILLSMPAKKGLIKNMLILLDNPDIELHPSGCRYLMKQLKKVAENNYLIYTTHSIFMIDRENIEQHYIVKKKNEITNIKIATEETYVDEEVLYKALGASVFEILKEKNILFEGWNDKKLFETAIKKNENYTQSFKNLGVSHAVGVKSVKNILPILEMGKRKCLIISDGENIAKQYQKEWQKSKNWGIWKRYDEIIYKRKIITAEDFIKDAILLERLKETLKEFEIDNDINKFSLPLTDKLNYIINKLSNKIPEEQKKEFIGKLKNKIFSNLKIEEIEDDYFEFLDELKEIIEKL